MLAAWLAARKAVTKSLMIVLALLVPKKLTTCVGGAWYKLTAELEQELVARSDVVLSTLQSTAPSCLARTDSAPKRR